jgi:hypothetical protein
VEPIANTTPRPQPNFPLTSDQPKQQKPCKNLTVAVLENKLKGQINVREELNKNVAEAQAYRLWVDSQTKGMDYSGASHKSFGLKRAWLEPRFGPDLPLNYKDRWKVEQYKSPYFKPASDLGNFTWGAVMRALGFGEFETKLLAQAATFKRYHQLDEPEDQAMIELGWRSHQETEANNCKY